MSELCGGCQVYLRDHLDTLKSREKLLKFLIDHGCLIESVRCVQCQRVVPLHTENLHYSCRSWLGYIFPKRKKKRKICCSFFLSGRRGTFFENASLSIEKICKFVLFWLMVPRTQLVFLKEQLNLSSTTAVKWSSHCRHICIAWVEKNAKPLGGNGIIVEIDVTKIWKRKHHRNSSAPVKWEVGGYERESGEIFLVQVEKKDKATLLEVIKERVLPGTTIIINRQYAFASLETEGYELKAVDPTEPCKGSENGVHINHILCFWRQVKESVPKFGYRLQSCEGYLCEFLFKRKFPDSRQRLHVFWTTAAEFYVPVASQGKYNGGSLVK